jgi:hypothetical protein
MAKRKKKPPVLMIIAILNILIALPCMCCLGSNAVVLVAMPPEQAANQPKPAANNPFGQMMAQQGEQLAFIAKESPGYTAEQIGYNIIAVLVSIGLLTSAIGLFMGQSWGRLLCMAACAVMVLAALGNTIYTVAYILPATKKFQSQQLQKGGAPPPPGTSEGRAAGSVIGIAGVLLVGAGYPVLAIGLLMTSPVRSFFSGGGRRPDDDYDDDFDRRAEQDDDRDDEDDRPRRRDEDRGRGEDDDRFRSR